MDNRQTDNDQTPDRWMDNLKTNVVDGGIKIIILKGLQDNIGSLA